jgi:hypothetical protein
MHEREMKDWLHRAPDVQSEERMHKQLDRIMPLVGMQVHFSVCAGKFNPFDYGC